jgi:FdrA protein
MTVLVEIRKNSYYDSVSLMNFSSRLATRPKVGEAAAVMGTEQNIDTLRQSGLNSEDLAEAEPNDLVIAVDAESEEAGREAIEFALETLEKGLGEEEEKPAEQRAFRTVREAAGRGANLALISTPGEYAGAEALKALKASMHVHLFSDNVPLEQEVALKQFAAERGLLVMGPDCGTAIVNGVPLAFSNAVRRGNVGVIAASGTGLQQVTSLLHRLGSGVSQAFGTGGRDLSGSVGGTTTKQALRELLADEETAVIVLVSKPPAEEVVAEVLDLAAGSSKPVVVCFLGADAARIEERGLAAASTLEEAAVIAAGLDLGKEVELPEGAEAELPELRPEQRYVRGLFSGGTFCYEALLILREIVGEVYSNTPLEKSLRLPELDRSIQHTCIDFGEDEFTKNRPHPMIDFRIRNQRIVEEARDPDVAVLLLDLVIGYGAHEDPAGAIVPAISEAKRVAQADGRQLPVVASVCGTDQDPQGLARQEQTLREAGVTVMPSNARAVELASEIAAGKHRYIGGGNSR